MKHINCASILSGLGGLALITSCAASNTANVPVFEVKLNQSLGMIFENSEWSHVANEVKKRLPDRGSFEEHEFVWRNGCRFVISIDRDSRRVSEWRYTSKPSICQTVRPRTFGT